ncbi:unnamed protein product, partial [Pylaiella littoralis]
RQHPQRLRLSSKQRIMCSRVCSNATMRRSAVEVRRLFHSSSATRRSSISSNTVDYGCSARRNYCSPSSSSSIPATAVGSWNQSLLRETVLRARAPALVLQRPRTFSSLLPQPSKTVTTTTKLSVDGGVMTISLPLPGLPGLTAVSVPVDVPVRDFVNELKALDKSLAEVDISNADGNKVARCTAMADVARRGLLISLDGGSRIRVESGGVDHGATEVPQPEVYALVQAEIIRAGRVTLTRDGLDALCDNVRREVNPEEAHETLDPILADGWLNALVEDGLVFTADKGRVVLLNPSGPGVSDEIASALRRDDELIDLKVNGLRQKLNAMHLEDARLQAIRNVLIAKARRVVTLKKSAVLAFMTAQFGILAYCVYEVFSWDVMEPATYFLMLSYSVGSSLYFSTKNREASFGNLEDVAIRKSEAKLKSVHGYSATAHVALKEEIKRYQDAVELLSSHRDAHPPATPSILGSSANLA